MVLSPLCPTYLNVRPSGTPPTQDHMLSTAARVIALGEQQKTMATYEDTKPAWMQQNHTMWTPKNQKK